MDVDGPEDDIDADMARKILEIVQVFADQHHSGASAGYCLSVLQKLLAFMPLTPLTGEDDEWDMVEPPSDDIATEMIGLPLFQNNRCTQVFKEATGKVYDMEAVVFVDKEGTIFVTPDSCTLVEAFPYTPGTKYVQVDSVEDMDERIADHEIELL